jgi:trimeric autotransporter adhesin
MSRILVKQINNTAASEGAVILFDGTKNLWSNQDTGALLLPVGSTAQEPVVPVQGMLRYNSDNSVLEYYNGTAWISEGSGSVTSVATGAGLTGGTITTSGTISVATNGITNSLFRQSAADTLVGNPTGSTGNVTDITLGSTLTFVTGVLRTTALSGDVTTSANSFVTTLATVNSNVGTFTALTVNGKGLVTAATNLALTGDVTGTASGSSLATTIANNAVTTAKINNSAVTYAKIQNEAATTLLGNPTGSSAAPSEITLGATLAFSGSALQTGALSGDVTTSANSFVTTIANSAVTNAKMANMANNTVKGNNSGGSAAPSDLTASNVLDMIGTVQGDVLYRNASTWVVLAPGTSGQVLTTGGAAANPSWTTNGSGTVTSVTFTGDGTLLSSTPSSAVTSSGTLTATLANASGGTVFGRSAGTTGAPSYTSTPVLGINASVAGTLGLANGSASGTTITLQNLGNTTAYNFNLPTTAGTAGQVLTSQAGGSTSMTWTTPTTGTVTSVATGSGLTGGTITSTGTISVATNGITNALFRQSAANTIVGNPTGSTANVTDITLGSTLSFVSGGLQTTALSGDITTSANSFVTTLATVNSNVGTFTALTVNGKGLVTAATNLALTGDVTGTASGSSLATTIANNAVTTVKINNAAVTYAKIQNESANTLLGNPTGSPAAPSEITLGTDLSFVAGAITHTNSGVTTGTYNQVTVDAQGHVTSGSTQFMTWNTITTATNAIVNNGYITNNTTLVTLTLPTTAAVGDIIPIVGRGTGGWKIAQNAGQTIHFGNDDTTTGTGGSLASTKRYHCAELVCIIANTDFVVRNSVGNITVT